MAKIKEKDGHKYSLEPFKGYKFRYKFVAERVNGEQIVNTDIYSTNDNRDEVENLLLNTVSEKYDISFAYSKIAHKASKEQDDRASELIDELLKDI